MQPLTIQIQLIEYRKESNDFIAKTRLGESFVFDPFVSCALSMTDNEYENGKGFDFVGHDFLMNHYTVTHDNVYSHEGGLIEITCDDSMENLKCN
tara:strand:- start:25547 stop:25831 length:285 start_codon:yes stop_codon:yes gene_type:complete